MIAVCCCCCCYCFLFSISKLKYGSQVTHLTASKHIQLFQWNAYVCIHLCSFLPWQKSEAFASFEWSLKILFKMDMHKAKHAKHVFSSVCRECMYRYVWHKWSAHSIHGSMVWSGPLICMLIENDIFSQLFFSLIRSVFCSSRDGDFEA